MARVPAAPRSFDNTAADHLIAFVGRGVVEDAVKASGHASAARLTPFLSTREMFALKLLASPDERNAYVAADVTHKRKLLETYGSRDPAEMMAHASALQAPIMIDSLEWFASPEDLCKLMVDLHERARQAATAPVGAILSMNPGIPDEKKQYGYIGFKGGSEPGVLNLSFSCRERGTVDGYFSRWDSTTRTRRSTNPRRRRRPSRRGSFSGGEIQAMSRPRVRPAPGGRTLADHRVDLPEMDERRLVALIVMDHLPGGRAALREATWSPGLSARTGERQRHRG